MSMTTTSGWSLWATSTPSFAVGGFADDFDVRVVLEDHPEPGPDQFLVVDQDHPDLAAHRSTSVCGSTGNRAWTRKPVGVDAASKSPP